MTGFSSPSRRPSFLLAAFLAAGVACALPCQAPAAPREQELNGGFTIARLKYKGGGDWYSDESSLRNLLSGLKERGDIRVSQEQEAVVTPTDPEIWNYPMLFMTGHGNVKMSEEETRALRSYLDSGGFLWADDNFGMDKSFRELLKRLYPDAPLTELPFSHAIFRHPNSFPSGAPKVHEHDGGPARVYAVMQGGRVRVLYTFDCDIGNGLEDAGVHDDPPEKRLAAMRFAINVATYAVTH